MDITGIARNLGDASLSFVPALKVSPLALGVGSFNDDSLGC